MLDPKTVIKVIEVALPFLGPYFADDNVTEIVINPGGAVYVETSGIMKLIPELTISEVDLQIALKACASLNNGHAIAGEKSAIVNGAYGGMRVAGALSPTSPDGSFLCIRKHLSPEKRPTLDKLIEWGALTEKQSSFVLKNFIEIDEPLNILIVGATGSGKTTYANALLKLIPKHQRVLTIEDVEELSTGLPNLVRVISNPDAKIFASDLVKGALRWSPTRIIVGETRGNETFDAIRAFNSGHFGSLLTAHASSARDGLGAIEMLYQMSLPGNSSISTEVVRTYISKAIKLVIYVDRRYVLLEDGSQKSIRKVREIVLVKGVKNGEYVLEDY
jgi:pilus assembly protein CpaF